MLTESNFLAESTFCHLRHWRWFRRPGASRQSRDSRMFSRPGPLQPTQQGECPSLDQVSLDPVWPCWQLELPLSPYRSVLGDCGVLLARAEEISDGTRDTVTIGRRNVTIAHVVCYRNPGTGLAEPSLELSSADNQTGSVPMWQRMAVRGKMGLGLG